MRETWTKQTRWERGRGSKGFLDIKTEKDKGLSERQGETERDRDRNRDRERQRNGKKE